MRLQQLACIFPNRIWSSSEETTKRLLSAQCCSTAALLWPQRHVASPAHPFSGLDRLPWPVGPWRTAQRRQSGLQQRNAGLWATLSLFAAPRCIGAPDSRVSDLVVTQRVGPPPSPLLLRFRLVSWLRVFSLEGSTLRSSRRSPQGDQGSGDKKSGSGGPQNGKDGNDDDDGDRPESWVVPRTCLFVLLMLVISLVLYRLSLPRGQHTGWASLLKHAGEIRQAVLYNNYLQVYLDDETVFLGLVNDQHTQRNMEILEQHYKEARAKAEQEQARESSFEKREPGGDTAEEGGSGWRLSSLMDSTSFSSHDGAHPEGLDLTMKGRPLAESALVGIGVVAWVVPFLFFPVFVMMLSQFIGTTVVRAADASRGSSKAKEMVFKLEHSSTTKFRDIAGMREPKKEITEIVDFLRHPERYVKLGAKIPTGALLLGPPGTGKTLLAKAVAGESGVGFIPVCGSDFVELYVGMGALRVRQLFKEARKQRCIIYIDEIDAIGLKRQGAGHGEKEEQERTLNELLNQLDGFQTGRRGDVMVLASSNVAQEQLDPALIRPGRFDRIVHVDTPVITERIDIFKVHLCKLKLVADPETSTEAEKEDSKMAGIASEEVQAVPQKEEGEPTSSATQSVEKDGGKIAAAAIPVTSPTATVVPPTPAMPTDEEATVLPSDSKSFDFTALLKEKSEAERCLIERYAERMSSLCPGFVGADIANVCNEGAILAAREGADHVDLTHLERSIDRVLAGIEHRSRALSDFEKTVVAHHEAGHAVAGWFLNRADPLMKVSIVPRGGSALGYAQYLPNENYTRTAKEIRDSISVTLGGRVAEQIFFQHLSTGASDDLRKVGLMAYQYVSSFAPGPVYPAPGSSSMRLVKPFGVDKSNELDVQAKKLVDDVYAETLDLLTRHKEDMQTLANHLLQHEVLTFSDVVKYLGTRTDRVRDKKAGV